MSAVVFSACSGEEANNDDCATPPGVGEQPIVGCELPPMVDPDANADDSSVLPPEVPAVNAIEVRDYLFTASSTLVDDTNIGFNYEPAMVSDGDFSTAWCKSSGDTEPSIVFDFGRQVKADKFGIVPGFARDEKIYKQNNRIKKATLLFDDKDPMEVEFKDEYGMQFVNLNGKEFLKIKLVINDVYKGNKYNDTCVSEWDFASAYVQKGDAAAALDYYVKEKKANALRPYDIVGNVMISDKSPDKCGNPVKDSGGGVSAEFGYDVFWNTPLYVTAFVNEFGREGDLVDIKYYHDVLRWAENSVVDPDGEVLDGYVHDYYELVDFQSDIPVKKSCDGKLYVNSVLSEFTYDMTMSAKDVVEIYSNDKLVGKVYFVLTQ